MLSCRRSLAARWKVHNLFMPDSLPADNSLGDVASGVDSPKGGRLEIWDLSPHFPLQAAESGAVKWRARLGCTGRCWRSSASDLSVFDSLMRFSPFCWRFFAVGLRRQAQHLQRRPRAVCPRLPLHNRCTASAARKPNAPIPFICERWSLTTIQISNPVMPRCSYTIRREVFMSNSSPVRSDRFLPDRWWTCAA